jgi:Haemolysin-III related
MAETIPRPHPWPFRWPGTSGPGRHWTASIGNLWGRRAGRELEADGDGHRFHGGAAAAGAFCDARHDVYYTKPALRGWLHLLWFEISVVSGTLLLARAQGATRITATAIYAASVSTMFGASALYHRGSWNTTWRQRLQPALR